MKPSTLRHSRLHEANTDVQAVKETIQRLREGHLMNIYPEGSRTHDGEIAPLLPGVALIVERSRSVVVPAVIVGAFEAWPLQRRFPRRRPIRIQFGPPMDLAGLKRDEILATIDRTLRSMFAALRSGSRPVRSARREAAP